MRSTFGISSTRSTGSSRTRPRAANRSGAISRPQDAVLRNLQVIGEAAKRVSDGTRASHPEVAWKDMAGMRDRVVHDYFGVSLDIVWDVVEIHLGPLRIQILPLLPTD